jgi:flagellar hook-associated protein 1 FlgK
MSTMPSLYNPALNRAETAGQIGQGMLVEKIERVRDRLLDERIIKEGAGEGYWGARDPYVRQLEEIYMEVGDSSVRARMDAFWDAWQQLANSPADMAQREAVLSRGESLTDSIHHRFNSLHNVSNMVNDDIHAQVVRLNELTGQIANLNLDIEKVRAQGDFPNDLMDRRDLLVDKLSKIISVTVDHRDTDEFMIHTGGNILVQGAVARQFVITPTNDDSGYGRIMWAPDENKIPNPLLAKDPGDSRPQPWMPLEFRENKGSLAALVELRDKTIKNEVSVLDNMTMNFVDMVNEIHREGYGINGKTGLDFFTEHRRTTNVNGSYDKNGDGLLDSTWIFRVNGGNKLNPNEQIGLQGHIRLSASRNNPLAGEDGLIDVPYYATDTVNEFIDRINNSGAEIVARINRNGELQLKATTTKDAEGNRFDVLNTETANPDFVMRHIEDVGENGEGGYFLSHYAGILNRGETYDWNNANAAAAFRGGSETYAVAPVTHPSGWLEVNNSIVRDKASIATGIGENGRAANPGNNKAALAIASLRNNPVMVGADKTFDDYFASSVARIGMMGEQSERSLATETEIMKNLRDMRQSISGVNMNEELANMIKYQHGYAAAARFVTTVNSMLDTLITRFG